VVVIPIERLPDVVSSAEEIMAKENAMLEAMRKGESIQAVDRRFNYETMLRAPSSDKNNP
jgi:regulator of RNase E activity RraA